MMIECKQQFTKKSQKTIDKLKIVFYIINNNKQH